MWRRYYNVYKRDTVFNWIKKIKTENNEIHIMANDFINNYPGRRYSLVCPGAVFQLKAFATG